jgi:two-component system osmolarity sensor histidine kinase EnvZ
LAKAAERFGKGQDIGDFKTSGASEVRLASAEFLKMKNRITRQIEQRSLMLAGVSHDLKTPLTRMRLQSESIKDNKIKDSLNDEIKHMNEMLSEYLEFSADQEINSKNIVNPIEALIKIKNDLHFKDKNIELEIVNDEESYVNENIFIRCITNVLNNAVENSTIIKIEAEATDNIIKINIHDNGIGIEDEEKENVLKPFYRIDKSRNQNVNNSGLGLAITKSLLNSINGKISLHDSSLGGLEVAIEIQN